MTGYNHYPNCDCSWCVNPGRSGIDWGAINGDFGRRDALHLLRQHLVNSITDCFVNSNAHCPVCNAPVFFYANEHGSRVFFNHLD